MTRPRRMLIVNVAALGHDLVTTHADLLSRCGLDFHALTPPFPAVTCVTQAVLRTAATPAEHGIVCNGRFDRRGRRIDFWNQSARLVRGPRIWDPFRRAGHTVGLLFWQQSLGERADLILSPAPIHTHRGGMIQDCYCKPESLYRYVCESVGGRFNLRHYWGPMASAHASNWIAAATQAIMEHSTLGPDLLFTYLPHLDYVLQKRGPDDAGSVRRAVSQLDRILAELRNVAERCDYDMVVWGDYAIVPCRRVVFPNRVLREAGLFRVRRVGRMTYPDLFATPAVAMADHQVAHVYLADASLRERVAALFAATDGIAAVMDRQAFGHNEAGDLVLTAAADSWFAYPWWDNHRHAPDYATHVDIHNKIGFDPCELFWGWPPPRISLDPAKVRGTHGAPGPDAALAATCPLPPSATTTRDFAAHLAATLAAWSEREVS